MIQITEQNRRLDNTDLARIEDRAGRPLPEDYRSFLLVHNGGRPEPDTIDIPESHFSPTNVQVFYGLDDEIESCDVFWNLELLEGCLENRLFPIAGDSFGNSFVLLLDDDNYGQVFYFNAAEIPPRPYFVAKDFTEFLDKIYKYKDDEEGEDKPPPTSGSNVDS